MPGNLIGAYVPRSARLPRRLPAPGPTGYDMLNPERTKPEALAPGFTLSYPYLPPPVLRTMHHAFRVTRFPAKSQAKKAAISFQDDSLFFSMLQN